MPDDLRTRIAAAALNAYEGHAEAWKQSEGDIKRQDWLALADAVIRELTDAIPLIVATAIQSWVQSEWAAISHHGAAGEYEMLKRLNREALQIARYATTHKDWNG